MLAVFLAAMLLSPAVVPNLDAAFDDRPAKAADDAGPRPFDETRNAMADVDAALLAAAERNTKALLVLGADWCHDSRAFAAMLEKPALAALVAERFELVFVDVGRRDRNLDVARRFAVDDLKGTPTVLIVTAGGELRNRDSVSEWTSAASRTGEELLRYLSSFAD
jgi:thioredoxin-like negative regulator of GroEL